MEPVPSIAGMEADSRRRLASILFDQQTWCWGQDIEHPAGNLLVAYGFQRIEKPEGAKGASLYRWTPSETRRIVLRGFGVFCGANEQGGLFVRRDGFRPRMTPDSDLVQPAWCCEDLPPLSVPSQHDGPRCQTLLLMMIDAIISYESWVTSGLGIQYRRDILVPWMTRHESLFDLQDMVAAWLDVQRAVLAWPEEFIP